MSRNLGLPEEYRVLWTPEDGWGAFPVTDDPGYRHLSAFGETPVEALEELGKVLSVAIEMRLDEMYQERDNQ